MSLSLCVRARAGQTWYTVLSTIDNVSEERMLVLIANISQRDPSLVVSLREIFVILKPSSDYTHSLMLAQYISVLNSCIPV